MKSFIQFKGRENGGNHGLRIRLFLMALVLTGAIGCGDKAPASDPKLLENWYPSVEELVKATFPLVEAGRKKQFRQAIVNRWTFIKEVFPYMPEARQEGAFTGESYWDNFLYRNRYKGVRDAFYRFQGSGYRVAEVFPAKKVRVLKFDDGQFIKFHRRIPVRLEKTVAGKPSGSTDKKLESYVYGLVVEKNGKFNLLQVYRPD